MYTDEQLSEGIGSLMDRARNKAVALRTVLSMLATNISELGRLVAGSQPRFGTGAPADALGNDLDTYENKANGDRYQKLNGHWEFQYNVKGAAGYTPRKGTDYNDGYTPRKGTDYFDGKDGKSAYQLWLDAGNTGTVATFLQSLKAPVVEVQNGEDGNNIFDFTYSPTSDDDIVGKDGDEWYHSISETAYSRYAKKDGHWRLMFKGNVANSSLPSSGVSSFNKRVGPVELTVSDVQSLLEQGENISFSLNEKNGKIRVSAVSNSNGGASNEEFLISRYGAIADNETNIELALRNALAAAGAAGGGVVRIPPGRFYLTITDAQQPLRIPDNVYLFGAGRGATQIRLSTLDLRPFHLTGKRSGAADFTLYCANMPGRFAFPANAGVLVGGQYNTVYNVEVYNQTVGILLDNAQDSIISGNYVHDTSGDGIAQFSYEGPNLRNKVVKNHIWNIGDDGISFNTYTVYPIAKGDSTQISGNHLRNILATGIAVWGGTNALIEGNTIDTTFNAGIKVVSSKGIGFPGSSQVKITGNTIRNSAMAPQRSEPNNPAAVSSPCAGILLLAYGDTDLNEYIDVLGNTVDTCQGSYIAAFSKGGDSVTHTYLKIKGNTCKGGTQPLSNIAGKESSGACHGIWINHAANCEIEGNTVIGAYANGICVDGQVIGSLQLLGNTVEDANRGGVNPAAAISINSPNAAIVGLGNIVADPNSRLVNAVYINPANAGALFTAEHNQLGGRAISSSAANGNAGTAANYTLTPPTGSSVQAGQPFNFQVTSNGAQACHHIDLFSADNGGAYLKTFNNATLPAALGHLVSTAGTYSFFAAVYTTPTSGFETNRVTITITAAQNGGSSGSEQSDTGGNVVDTTPNSRRFKENFAVEKSDGGFTGWHVGITGEGDTFKQGYIGTNGQNLLMQLQENKTGGMAIQTDGGIYDLTKDPLTIKWIRVPTNEGQDTGFGIATGPYSRTNFSIVNGKIIAVVVTYSGSGSPAYAYANDLATFNMDQHRHMRFQLIDGEINLVVSSDNVTYSLLHKFQNPYGSVEFSTFVYTYNDVHALASPAVVEVDYVEYTK